MLLKEQEKGPVLLPLGIYMKKVHGTLESLDHYVTEGVFWSGKYLARSGGNPEIEFTCHFSYAELAVSRVPRREGKRFTGNVQPGCVQLYDYIISLSVSVNFLCSERNLQGKVPLSALSLTLSAIKIATPAFL